MLQYEFKSKDTIFKKGDKVKTLDFWIFTHPVVGGDIGIIKFFQDGNALIQKDNGLCTFWDARHLKLIH